MCLRVGAARKTSTKRLTVPLDETLRPASASTAMMVAISWTSVLVSRAFVDLERSCDSLARTQGCFETCTLAGRALAMMVVVRMEKVKKRERMTKMVRSIILGSRRQKQTAIESDKDYLVTQSRNVYRDLEG